jgi:hypothetical protein
MMSISLVIWFVVSLLFYFKSLVSVASIVSLIGMFIYRSLVSSVSSVWLLLISSFIRLLARLVELGVVYRLSCRQLLIVFTFLAVLYEGAFLLLITGLIGAPGLCTLSKACNVGGFRFFYKAISVFVG